MKYDSRMERVTATIDEETLIAIRRVAGRRGVSAFLQIAARERLARLRILSLLDELDSAHGAPSDRGQVSIGVRNPMRRCSMNRLSRPLGRSSTSRSSTSLRSILPSAMARAAMFA